MEKQEKIIKMFDEIAPTYDKANRAISLGVDTSWRKAGVGAALEYCKNKSVKIADVACGTGDMIKIWEELAPKHGVSIEQIIGIDPSVGMLGVAKEKFKDHTFITATATQTTLENASVDIVSISYGIRNVVALDEALREFNRVIKPGGLVVVLEFTKAQNGGLVFKMRDFYVSKILPLIGGAISKNKEAYEYLPSSIGNFLDTVSFKEKLINSGFEPLVIKGFSFDVSTLFIAKKVRDA
ncbi:bifunctional demethylmenaquinone methyltransferase/2-methoxy-6-polyprenyl-1,4-benzoquinol methylase UbiE [Campylobacter sp. JMF_04 NA10]|uniref:bifunctional demethylmenaquinone methyltransferase/2-methoxy-6-polyprenyl-1,4-benzoquinol methylase UbiE n=1 Tax=Campylobacter sp. JMF_04 NA10 TaxID=2983824 RepID=UPI0022EA00E3|nr:bifunctional demethylmenaquinone methyltransferase/2-methoxy-6-polyprenyl-1,4-benzoquinol methylase UbiE [Campylobacter sp. JMF_04 NA10]MDA3076044.1 bifunctional demethylmenaquinone methyltransferase/2-methoxy-6-polyprenyl-1,4-benzoquinol methylase UbiE [Campylobacter sp. JMF_04 NA10]